MLIPSTGVNIGHISQSEIFISPTPKLVKVTIKRPGNTTFIITDNREVRKGAPPFAPEQSIFPL